MTATGRPPRHSRLAGHRVQLADDARSTTVGLTDRDDARTWDIGYCRSVVRADGRVVTVYYYATAEHFENHIGTTIWSP